MKDGNGETSRFWKRRFINRRSRVQVLFLGKLKLACIATGKTTKAGRIQYVLEKVVEE